MKRINQIRFNSTNTFSARNTSNLGLFKTRLAKLTFFILLSFSLTACAQNNSEKDTALNVKTNLVKTPASKLVDSALKYMYTDGGSPENLDKAIIHINNSIKLDSSKIVSYQIKSDILLWQNKPKLAIESLTHWVNKNPKDETLLLKRGLIYHRLRMNNEALADFTAVKKLITENPVPIKKGMDNMGYALAYEQIETYFLIGHNEEAFKMIEKLKVILPDSISAKAPTKTPTRGERERIIKSKVGF